MSEHKNNPPFGWIQWKGTDVCIDIHCLCGKLTHFDGDFMYFIKCPYCNRIYECDGHIKLVEKNRVTFEGSLLRTSIKDVEDL